MVTKGDIVEGAYKLLTIWGISLGPSNEDTTFGLEVIDDYAKQLESDGLMMGYISPEAYGQSDPNDDSGLSDWMAGPMKKLLAIEVMTAFGKPLTPQLLRISEQGLRSLEHAIVKVPVAQNPGTLPKGSGNEWAYRDNKFYSEPPSTLDTETDGSLNDLIINNNDNMHINSD